MTQSNVSVGIGQRARVADDGLGVGRRRYLAGIGHGREHRVDVAELVGVLVECHDVGAAPVRLEAVPTRTAADVDDLGAGADTETVEIDCQHSSPTAWLRYRRPPPCARWPARRPARSARQPIPS